MDFVVRNRKPLLFDSKVDCKMIYEQSLNSTCSILNVSCLLVNKLLNVNILYGEKTDDR